MPALACVDLRTGTVWFGLSILIATSCGCESSSDRPDTLGSHRTSSIEITAIPNAESITATTTATTATAVSLPSLPSSPDIQSIIREVELLLNALIESFPKDSDAFDLFGRYYYLIGNHDRAFAMWDSGIKLNENDAYCLNGLGMICQARNDYQTAEAHFRAAASLKANDPSVQLNLAKTLLKQGNFDEAITANLKSVQLNSSNVEAWESLGQLYLANQQYALAKQAFEETLKRSSTSHVAYQGIAQCLIRLDQAAEASSWLKKQQECRSKNSELLSSDKLETQERAKVSQLLGLVSNVYLKHRQVIRAIQTLSYSVDCAPGEYSSRQNFIQLCHSISTGDAIPILQDLIDKRPDEIAFRFGLFELYLRQNEWNKARSIVGEAIDREPKNPQGYISLIQLLLQMPNSNSQELLVASNKLIQLRGSAADYVLRARTLHHCNHLPEAKAAVVRALELEPNNQAYKKILSQLQAEDRTR